MTNRLNFSRKTKAQAFARSGGKCECGKCGGIRLVAGKFQYHHIKEANDGGDNSLENCLVITNECHKPLTKKYIQETRKAERIRDKHIGAFPDGRKLSGPGFHKVQPQRRASKPVNKWYGYKGQTI